MPRTEPPQRLKDHAAAPSHAVRQILALQGVEGLLVPMVKGNVVLLLVVHVALCDNGLDQSRVERGLGHVLPPVLPQRLCCLPQVVPARSTST